MGRPQVLVSVDHQNVVHGFMKRRKFSDYRRILFHLRRALDLPAGSDIHYLAFVGLPPKPRDASEEARWGKMRHATLGLMRHLSLIGVEVFNYKAKISHGDGQRTYDANVDTDLVARTLGLALHTRPDEVVICSGDSDFSSMAHVLRDQGIYVTAASFRDQIGDLRHAVDRVIDLEPIAAMLPNYKRRSEEVG